MRMWGKEGRGRGGGWRLRPGHDPPGHFHINFGLVNHKYHSKLKNIFWVETWSVLVCFMLKFFGSRDKDVAKKGFGVRYHLGVGEGGCDWRGDNLKDFQLISKVNERFRIN